jgi:hypothetical protein
MNKNILLASFIFKDKTEIFLNYLEKSFNIPKDTVFIYDVSDEYKYMVTFKLTINDKTKIDFKKDFYNATLIHKRGTAIYSINALNKLIDSLNEDNIGNIDYKTFKIDWNQYQDKLMLVRNNNLIITPINRIF